MDMQRILNRGSNSDDDAEEEEDERSQEGETAVLTMWSEVHGRTYIKGAKLCYFNDLSVRLNDITT